MHAHVQIELSMDFRRFMFMSKRLEKELRERDERDKKEKEAFNKMLASLAARRR